MSTGRLILVVDDILANHDAVFGVVATCLKEMKFLQSPANLDVFKLLGLVHSLRPELKQAVANLEFDTCELLLSGQQGFEVVILVLLRMQVLIPRHVRVPLEADEV